MRVAIVFVSSWQEEEKKEMFEISRTRVTNGYIGEELNNAR